MARHQVRNAQKDENGNVTHIGNGDRWQMSSEYAIQQLRATGGDRFYVRWKDHDPIEVGVVEDEDGRYLRTVRDSNKGNNLDSLPDLW